MRVESGVVIDTFPASSAQQYWETFYRDNEQIWSGRPNPRLVREVASLAPGTALDLGCGQGADAIWLAGLGWQVTATDVSGTALRRAAARACRRGSTTHPSHRREDGRQC